MRKKFSPDMYRYVENGNTVIAISSYAGKTVKGVAKCDPNDEFNLESGKKLAAARCNEKVCKQRLRRANTLYTLIEKTVNYWQAELEKVTRYADDAREEYIEARNELSAIQEEM